MLLVSCRCPNCIGWPVSVGCQYETLRCGYCEEEVEDEIVNKYFKFKREFLCSEITTVDAAFKHLNLLFSVFHPYDLCFVAICQITLFQYLKFDLVKEAVDMANVLKTLIAKLIPKSTSDREIKDLIFLLKKMV